MAHKPYKGQFTSFENPEKYLGDVNNCIYRSSWERSAFRWCDLNENVEEWASEELSIYYHHPITGKRSKYYPDLFIKTAGGDSLVVEIKPKHQTSEPKMPARKTKKYAQDYMTWLVNQAKWEAAVKVCNKNNLRFQVWTEETLDQLGINKLQSDGQTLLKEKGELKRKTLSRKKPVKRRTTPRPKRKS